MVEISHVTADSFAAMAWSAGPLPRDACSSSTRSFPTAPRSCLSGARHGVRSRALPRISCDLAIFRWEFGWRFRGFNGVFGLGFPRGVLCSMGFWTGFCIFYGNLGNLCGSSMVVWGLGWESSTLPTCKNKKRWPKIAVPVSGKLADGSSLAIFTYFHKTPLCFPHLPPIFMIWSSSEPDPRGRASLCRSSFACCRWWETPRWRRTWEALSCVGKDVCCGSDVGYEKSARVEASITSGLMSTPD